MNQKKFRITIAGMAGVLSIMLCGCKTPVLTHNVAYDLTPHVSRASTREAMKPQLTNAEITVVCAGSRSASNDIAMVSVYHCEKPSAKEIYQTGGVPSLMLGVGSAIWTHVLQTPEPIGKYVERTASVALASRGIGRSPQTGKKLLLLLERFDYDENSGRKKGGPMIMPWQVFSDTDGVLRKGFMDVVVKVVQADGTIAYQRRVSVETSRKRGQASATAAIASVVIAQVSPITINSEAVREKEEKTVTTDVLSDLFAKFQDELVADEDLLRAIRK